jgi:hypothetical protein
MDLKKARQLEAEVIAMLKPLAEKHGMAVRLKGGTIYPSELLIKVSIAEKSESGEALTREAITLRDHAEQFGLPKDCYGKTVIFNHMKNEEFVLIGIKPRSWRFPVLAKRKDGKVFKFPINTVRKSLGLTPVAEVERNPWDD